MISFNKSKFNAGAMSLQRERNNKTWIGLN